MSPYLPALAGFAVLVLWGVVLSVVAYGAHWLAGRLTARVFPSFDGGED